jgi:hypothetical protein
VITKIRKISPHALSQLEKRCGIILSQTEVRYEIQNAERLYVGSNGTAWLFKVGNYFGVFIEREGDIVTAISLGMAYANCRRAVFYSLVYRGELTAALMLRGSSKLPSARGTDDATYKYARAPANAVWAAFHWAST